MVKDNIQRIKEKISEKAISLGRNPDEIKLMAVSKYQNVSKIEEAYQGGISLFGENRVKEASEKFHHNFKGIELHLIGHLQRNKAKLAAETFDWIQSIDSYRTIQALIPHLEKNDKKLNILLQVNTSKEETKGGYIGQKQLYDDIEKIIQHPLISIRGLMTMAPFTQNEKVIRMAFQNLREIFKSIKEQYSLLDFDTLSMGMSNDYLIALEEGSTLLRIGTAIFGKREF
jgi:pyridoxal phosphate enzyme (YggS family)